MKTALSATAFAFVGLLVLAGCQTTDRRKDFSEKEVAEIKTLLEGFDPKVYRVIVPTFKENRIVGSETIGSLPVSEVRKVASVLNVSYAENGNLQAIFQSCNGGGAGSHTDSQSGARGADLGRKVESILQNLDKSRYVFLAN